MLIAANTSPGAPTPALAAHFEKIWTNQQGFRRAVGIRRGLKNTASE